MVAWILFVFNVFPSGTAPCLVMLNVSFLNFGAVITGSFPLNCAATSLKVNASTSIQIAVFRMTKSLVKRRELILQFYLKPSHFQGFREGLFTQSFPSDHVFIGTFAHESCKYAKHRHLALFTLLLPGGPATSNCHYSFAKPATLLVKPRRVYRHHWW